MPSKSMSEFEYRHLSRGLTIWEKLRELERYLVTKRRAAKQQAVDEKRSLAKRAKLKHLKENSGLEHEILELEADILVEESFAEEAAELYNLNLEEIALLERLVAEARGIAEHTRIPGYTDEQMFDANAANEYTAGMVKKLQADFIATGCLNPVTLKDAMLVPQTFVALKQLGYLPPDTGFLLPSNDPMKIEFELGGAMMPTVDTLADIR